MSSRAFAVTFSQKLIVETGRVVRLVPGGEHLSRAAFGQLPCHLCLAESRQRYVAAPGQPLLADEYRDPPGRKPDLSMDRSPTADSHWHATRRTVLD